MVGSEVLIGPHAAPDGGEDKSSGLSVATSGRTVTDKGEFRSQENEEV